MVTKGCPSVSHLAGSRLVPILTYWGLCVAGKGREEGNGREGRGRDMCRTHGKGRGKVEGGSRLVPILTYWGLCVAMCQTHGKGKGAPGVHFIS